MAFHKILYPVAISLALASGAAAQTGAWPGFASTAGLSLKGKAASAATADGTILRLTKSVTHQAGSAFTTSALPFAESTRAFSTFFQFRLTNPGGIEPADGIVFVLRSTNSEALGQDGGAQGYDGIQHSIGIKFDTFRNENEINDNHVAIQTNGVWLDEYTQTAGGVANCEKPTGIAGCMSNGHVWSVWIDYDGAVLHVAVADGSTTRPPDLIAAPVQLGTILGSTSAHAGFTAATGAGTQNHDILNWVFYNTYNPTPIGVPQTLPHDLIVPNSR